MINIKANLTTLNIGPQAGKDRFVMQAMSYSTLSEAKVISEAAARTNMSKQLIRACWESCAEIIKAWATEGHSIPIPGLGHMRFGIRATSVEKVEDVKTGLITSRRVIFVPSVEIKDELAKTSISITCYDKDGKKIKTVTSTDKDDIEEDDGGTETSNSSNVTNNSGSSDSGSNTGGNSGGSSNENVTLTLRASGNGSVSIDGGTAGTTKFKSVAPGTSVAILATPASGASFAQWSDGNTEASRNVTVNEAMTLTATFTGGASGPSEG